MYHTQPSATATKPSQIHSFFKNLNFRMASFFEYFRMWSIDVDNIYVSNIAPSSLLTLSNAINIQQSKHKYNLKENSNIHKYFIYLLFCRKRRISLRLSVDCYKPLNSGGYMRVWGWYPKHFHLQLRMIPIG